MIELNRDTVTRPTEEMREAARNAEVGDSINGEDPSVNELNTVAAEMLGMDAAIFVPSGTMANQIAAWVHTDPGQSVLVESESHINRLESAGLARFSDVQPRELDGGERGVPSPTQVHNHYVPDHHYTPSRGLGDVAVSVTLPTGLLVLENTHLGKGGTAISPERIDAVVEAAHEHDVPVHLDGTRLFNAAVAHQCPVARFTEQVDSVNVALSKGLGAPVGSIVAGSEEFIDHARKARKMFGGGWRQAGIVAAPALVALDDYDHLANDHENARVLAKRLAECDGLAVEPPETNILRVDTTGTGLTANEFLARCEKRGVSGLEAGEYSFFFMTHRDVDRSDVDTAVDRIRDVLAAV